MDKLRYQVLFDILDSQKALQPQASGTGSEGRKRPESSSPEKLKARNKEKYVEQAEKEAAEEDNYEEEEFEKLLDKDDEDNNNNQEEKQGEEGEEGEEEYIDEEQMLDVAERCFVKIADAIMVKQLTVRQAFQPYILKETLEEQTIELLSPIGFLEGLKELGLTELEEVEVACLMRVLTKPELENAILLKELAVIMENFGIGEGE